MDQEEQFAVFDSASGQWWSATADGWSPRPTVYDSYAVAAVSGAFTHLKCRRPMARIVPAPPREMTDAEARTWFTANAPGSLSLRVESGYTDNPCRFYVAKDNVPGVIAYGATIEDAIRAARRTLKA